MDHKVTDEPKLQKQEQCSVVVIKEKANESKLQEREKFSIVVIKQKELKEPSNQELRNKSGSAKEGAMENATEEDMEDVLVSKNLKGSVVEKIMKDKDAIEGSVKGATWRAPWRACSYPRS